MDGVDYEAARQANVERNEAMMQSLGITDSASDLARLKAAKPQREKKVKVLGASPSRISSRNEGKEKVSYTYDLSDRALGIHRESKPRGPGSVDWHNTDWPDKAKAEAAAARAEEFVAKCELPATIKVLLKSHVSGGFWLQLPAQFCQCMPDTIEDPVSPQVMFDLFGHNGDGLTKEVPDGDVWEVIWLPKGKGGGGLSGGWRGFSIDNNLAVGDTIVFEKLEGNLLRGTIFRAIPLAENVEYMARPAAKVAKVAEEVAEGKAKGLKRRYATITIRENAYRNSLADGVPYKKALAKKKAKKKAAQVEEVEAGEEFIVEKLLETRRVNGAREFLVKWWGYEAEADLTWEGMGNLDDALDSYEGYAENIAPKLSKAERNGAEGKSSLEALAKKVNPKAKAGAKGAGKSKGGSSTGKAAAAKPAKAAAPAKGAGKTKGGSSTVKTVAAKPAKAPAKAVAAKGAGNKRKRGTKEAAASFRVAGEISPGRETLPKVGERLEVAFTDQPYVGTVTALRRCKEPARKRRNSAVGAAGKVAMEFEVHFDADDEKVWVGQGQLWSRVQP